MAWDLGLCENGGTFDCKKLKPLDFATAQAQAGD